MELAIEWCAESIPVSQNYPEQTWSVNSSRGDEGGFATDLSDSESVLEVILEAVKMEV